MRPKPSPLDVGGISRRASAARAGPRSVCLPLVFFFFATYAVWLYQFGIARYAVALEMLAPLVILALLDLLCGQLQEEDYRSTLPHKW